MVLVSVALVVMSTSVGPDTCGVGHDATTREVKDPWRGKRVGVRCFIQGISKSYVQKTCGHPTVCDQVVVAFEAQR